MNNTSKPGILIPSPEFPVLDTMPPKLTLVQFIQTLLVGLSELQPGFVRPDWQPQPPKQPDIDVDWIAYGIRSVDPDNSAYVNYDQSNNPFLMRNETLQIAISYYGPNAYDIMGLVRDGFQIQQNNASLKLANMGFGWDTPAQHVPDLVNERWINKFVTDVFLRRQIIRDYPILSFVSANGIIYSQTKANEDFQQTWQVTGS